MLSQRSNNTPSGFVPPELPSEDLNATVVGNGGCNVLDDTKKLNDESSRPGVTCRIGDQVGRYLLLSKLGAGAMGVVYKAYDPDLDRKVALKFIHVEGVAFAEGTGATAASKSQLMDEAQAMARVAHPNVVTIFDVGIVDSNVYLAMELVEGQTMKEWIRHGGYSRSEMLRVLLAAGRGLASAHEAGLVHRDFKPDNVLLGSDDRVCVADFGLVRRELDRSSLDHGATHQSGVMGTPSYMSPEQHRGEVATPLSDQFSYCVSLFEAAYGVCPFLGRDLKEISAAIDRGQMTVPVSGHHVPRWLHRIIARGLSTKPGDRYPSMQALLAELSFDRKAVLRKWGAGTGLAATLFVGISIYEVNATENRLQCRLNPSSIEEIWSDSARSAAQSVFRQSNLRSSVNSWPTINEIMQRKVRSWSTVATNVCQRYEDGSAYSKDFVNQQLDCLGSQLAQLRTFSELMQEIDSPTLDRSLRVARGLDSAEECQDPDFFGNLGVWPEDPHQRLVVQELRNDVHRAEMLRNMGKHTRSIELAEDLILRANRIDFPSISAEIYLLMARQRCDLQQVHECNHLNFKALANAEASEDDRLLTLIASQAVFINGAYLQDSLSVDDWISHAYAHLRRAEMPRDLHAELLSVMGAAYGRLGRLEESEAVFREALEINEQEIGIEDVKTLRIRNNLAATLVYEKKLVEAVYHYRAIVEIGANTLGENHPMLLLSHSNLAEALGILGLYDEALVYADRAVRIAEETSGRNAPQWTRLYDVRAQLLLRSGKNRRGLTAARQILDLSKKNTLRRNFGSLYSSEICEVLIRLGRIDEAAQVMARLDVDDESIRDPNGWKKIKVQLMSLALRRGQVARAEKTFLQWKAYVNNSSPIRLNENGKVNLVVGNLHLAMGRLNEAIKFHQKAYSEAREQFPGEGNVNLVPYERALARSHAATGDLDSAIEWVNQAIVKLHEGLSSSPHLLASAYLQRAQLQGQQQRWKRAWESVETAQKHILAEEMDPREVNEIEKFRDFLSSREDR